MTLSPEETRHLRDVLRLSAGDRVFVFDGSGKEFECTVGEVRRDFANLTITSAVSPARPESPLQLTLGIALLKGEKFDLVVQKTTELGVQSIVPLITKLADIHLRDPIDAEKRRTRWQRIAIEGAKQSGRAAVPDISLPVRFGDLIRQLPADGERLLFSERAGLPLDTIAHGSVESIIAIVGSEGGWTDEELAEANEAGWKIVTLGGRILRAETAAIAITALLQHRFGDFK